jgi:hypothetical protein
VRVSFPRLAVAIAPLCLCGASLGLKSDVQVRAVRHGQEIEVSDQDKLATRLLVLLQSCSVESTAYAVSSGTWPKWMSSDSLIYVSFAKSRRVQLMNARTHTRQERRTEEVLLPLPEGKLPDHIYVRSGKDRLAFTKCDVGALRSAVSDEGFQLPE